MIILFTQAKRTQDASVNLKIDPRDAPLAQHTMEVLQSVALADRAFRLRRRYVSICLMSVARSRVTVEGKRKTKIRLRPPQLQN